MYYKIEIAQEIRGSSILHDTIGERELWKLEDVSYVGGYGATPKVHNILNMHSVTLPAGDDRL